MESEPRRGRSLKRTLLGRMGFTKYVKGDKGYEKVVGKGPDFIKKKPKG